MKAEQMREELKFEDFSSDGKPIIEDMAVGTNWFTYHPFN